MHGGVDIAVNWMGLDFMIGALVRICCDGAHGQRLLNLGWRRSVNWRVIGGAGSVALNVFSISWLGWCIDVDAWISYLGACVWDGLRVWASCNGWDGVRPAYLV